MGHLVWLHLLINPCEHEGQGIKSFIGVSERFGQSLSIQGVLGNSYGWMKTPVENAPLLLQLKVLSGFCVQQMFTLRF